jgi:hypothetical protein
MSIRENYVYVREAARFLGVASNTIRAWGASGKIPEHRHPVNGHGRIANRTETGRTAIRAVLGAVLRPGLALFSGVCTTMLFFLGAQSIFASRVVRLPSGMEGAG